MDPLTAGTVFTAVVFSAIKLATTVTAAVKAVADVSDDKYDEIYWRVYAEKETTLGWVRRMAFTSYRPPPENDKRFELLLKSLVTHYQRMETQLEKLYMDPNRTEWRAFEKMEVLARRLRFHLGYFEELKQTLNTINAMNAALDAMAPALPEYAAINSVHPGSNAVTVPVRGANIQSTPVSQAEGPVTYHSTGHKFEHVRKHPQLHDFRTLKRREARKRTSPYPLHVLHTLAVEALDLLKDDYTNMPAIISRLEIWAQGVFRKGSLFGPSLDLENVFVSTLDQLGQCFLGDFVLGKQVSILISALSLLEETRDSYDDTKHDLDNIQAELGELMSRIMVALAQERVRDMARAKYEELQETSMEWDNFFETYGSEADGSDSDAPLDHTALPSTAYLQDIDVAVACLIEVLPAIHSCQQAFRLDLERQDETPKAERVSDEIVEELQDDQANVTSDKKIPLESISRERPPLMSLEDYSTIVDLNLQLANDLVSKISGEMLKGPLGEKLKIASATLSKQADLLRVYQGELASASAAKAGDDTEVSQEAMDAALKQTKGGLEMVELSNSFSELLSPKPNHVRLRASNNGRNNGNQKSSTKDATGRGMDLSEDNLDRIGQVVKDFLASLEMFDSSGKAMVRLEHSRSVKLHDTSVAATNATAVAPLAVGV